MFPLLSSTTDVDTRQPARDMVDSTVVPMPDETSDILAPSSQPSSRHHFSSSTTAEAVNVGSAESRSTPQPPPSSPLGPIENVGCRWFEENMLFDGNTFKQVKRLFAGMLLVATVYSLTIIVMMVSLYKSLPELHHKRFNSLGGISLKHNGGHLLASTVSDGGMPIISKLDIDKQRIDEKISSITSHLINDKSPFYRLSDFNARPTRPYLDQVITINFLIFLLYLLSFYAAHRELYTLTWTLTFTLAFTMIYSMIKLFIEGCRFPNNFMSLMLRICIVLIALIYLGQLRRKHRFIRRINNYFISSSSLPAPSLNSIPRSLIHPSVLLQSRIRHGHNNNPSTDRNNKSNDQLILDYHDLPPNYEEALQCSAPFVNQSLTADAGAAVPIPKQKQSDEDIGKNVAIGLQQQKQRSSSLPPPSFEESTTAKQTIQTEVDQEDHPYRHQTPKSS